MNDPTGEQRQHPRRATILGAELRSGARAWLAVTRDISRSGAMLLSESWFEDGEIVELVLVDRAPSEEHHLRGMVVRSTRATHEGPLRWELAFSFLQELPEDSPLLEEVAEPDEKA